MPRVNNLSVGRTGFTLLEALIVIAIIATLSVLYVVNLRPNTIELLKMDTTRLAADIRYIRSMSTSRVAYDDGVNPPSFPSGGYGIVFQNGAGNTNSWYKLYAGSTAHVIKTVELSNQAFRLVDPNGASSISVVLADTSLKSFAFVDEGNITATGLDVSVDGDYQVEIYYPTDALHYSKAKINIGRKTADNFVWSNLAITYDTKGIECGNGVVESGEVCERYAEDGVTIVNPNCFPADSVKGCQLNGCGDGVIAGNEQCERNTAAIGGRYYLNMCSNVTPHVWCYTCLALNNTDGCRDIDGNSQNCCAEHLSSGHCVDCQWDSNVNCPMDAKPPCPAS